MLNNLILQEFWRDGSCSFYKKIEELIFHKKLFCGVV